jgi:large subunit ribosomal protein L7/L12
MDDLHFRLRQLEEQVERLSSQAGTPWSAAMTPQGDGGVDSQVVALAQSGQKIEAIKRYRELTGVGLVEAKQVVEGL